MVETTDDHEISKTAKKKIAQEFFQITKKISKMTAKQIEKLDLDDEIKREFLLVKNIKSFSAHERQLKFIAKRLRDEENLERLKKIIKN
ncbi:MAG: hypothetical protein CMP11_00730 [Zetaproteobacteria bacterium]|nr:hypothetical protein [Pseudobdellovibrionaceae bacterium]|tara:strand:- start:285 stop:551 length:267 start_codon:yes stop_codon:yes gene_type:complete